MIEALYTLSVAIPVTLSALGTSIGQGLIGKKALHAIDIQPHASHEIRNASLVGIAITETAAVLGLVVSIFLYNDLQIIPASYYYASIARLGIGIAIGVTGLVAGITSSFPAQAACISVSRQPFFSANIINIMIMTQTVIMTPNLFGFIIALFIRQKFIDITNLTEALQLLTTGMVIGFGSIGPSIGLSLFTQGVCTAIGINRKVYKEIVPFSFVGQAVIETPIILSLVTALFIMNSTVTLPTDPSELTMQAIIFIAATICMVLSTIGTGISAGKTGAAACIQIGNNIEEYGKISQISFLCLAMIDTFAIFGFIVATMLLYTI
jgi:F-type H+-transporting ATPase subunit c